MKHILCLAYSQESNNFDEVINFFGQEIRVTQYSVNFDFDLCKNIILKYDGLCDVICLTGVPPVIKYQKGFLSHPETERLKSFAKETPVVDGHQLKNTYFPYSIRKLQRKNTKILTKKKISFFAASFQYPVLEVLEEYDNQFIIADPFFFTITPKLLSSRSGLDSFLKMITPIFRKRKIGKRFLANFKPNFMTKRLLSNFYNSEIFVGNESTLLLIDCSMLKGKTIVVDFLGSKLKAKLAEAGVERAIVAMPKILDSDKANFPILEAILQSMLPTGETLSDDKILNWIEELDIEAQIIDFENNDNSSDKFAFIIHPLGASHLFKHPALRFLKDYSKKLEPVAEDIMATLPGFFYGTIDGIVSEKNGRKIQGLIYTVTETPKKLLDKDVDVIYRKLISLCEKASSNQAKLIGLGAYTKIVGDAGVTVEAQSPIPVTTGNSLSACSTLWAAKFALEKINLVKTDKKTRKYQGRAMVIGATGSIGAVSAKILAGTWEEIVLVAPRGYKLLELKEDILKIHPDAKISVSTNPDNCCDNIDLFITTTSAQGKKILDIEKVKPGAVICDVSRPFDISEEDALKRPDVLVIASGEVHLPGNNVKINVDLGLEGNVVYACLAETALLCLEGKNESFTLGRNINYKKVLEIDRLASEHGVRLSNIMGHSGFITDQEFELCRAHAIEKLKTWNK